MASAIRLVPKTVEETRAMIEAMSPADRAHLSPEWVARVVSAGTDHWTLGYKIIRAEDDAFVGQCGFKGAPREGIVEIAYSVEPACEGRGYATEAARMLVGVAFAHDDVKSAIAHTLENTNASSRVLVKNGFACVGQVMDPEDGTVWRWERKRGC